MPKSKNSLNLDQLKSLCNYDEASGNYIAKSGQKYIEALSKIVNIVNKNDLPIGVEDIIKQPLIDDFKFKGKDDFIYTCDLTIKPLAVIDGIRQNEKIMPCKFSDDNAVILFNSALGIAYMFTAVVNGKEYIVKIGQSRTSFKQRLASYNCGVVNNWRTASTTNIKVLQSMQTTRVPFKLYLCDCSNDHTF